MAKKQSVVQARQHFFKKLKSVVISTVYAVGHTFHKFIAFLVRTISIPYTLAIVLTVSNLEPGTLSSSVRTVKDRGEVLANDILNK